MSNYRERAAALVAQMTLEEKVGQTLYNAPAVERLGIPAYNWWNEALHGVARAGTATVFPQAIGVAATFDEDLTEKMAESSGRRPGQNITHRKKQATGISIRGLPSGHLMSIFSGIPGGGADMKPMVKTPI